MSVDMKTSQLHSLGLLNSMVLEPLASSFPFLESRPSLDHKGNGLIISSLPVQHSKSNTVHLCFQVILLGIDVMNIV